MAETTQHIQGTFEYFITLPDEKLILAIRKHWSVVSREICFIFLLSFLFYLISYFVCTKYFHSPLTFISSILVVTCIAASITLKSIVDWTFHLFIVTNRKILEVCFSPLFYYKINGVLLDQVRCTEIDEKKHGIVNEIVDMGDIVITFDRPTHQEEFILTDIKDPRGVAVLLSNMFASLDTSSSQPVWFRSHQGSHIPSIPQNVFRRYSLGR